MKKWLFGFLGVALIVFCSVFGYVSYQKHEGEVFKQNIEKKMPVDQINAHAKSYKEDATNVNNGMDTSEKAIPYIATWTKNGQTLDDKEAAERGKIMNDVSRVANEFIQTISNEINQYREREPEIQPAEVKQDEKNVVETAEQKNIVPVGSLWIDKKDGKVLEEDTGRTLHLKDAAFIEDPQHNQVILKGKSYGKEIQTALPSEEFALGNPFRFSLETVSEVAKRKNEIYYEQQLSQKERV
ncbi:hypothetical protein EID67_12625 [Enterococcus faecium]|nr:hypothetical protein [Enterococcus faecium]